MQNFLPRGAYLLYFFIGKNVILFHKKIYSKPYFNVNW